MTLFMFFALIACHSGNFGRGAGDIYFDGVVQFPWLLLEERDINSSHISAVRFRQIDSRSSPFYSMGNYFLKISSQEGLVELRQAMIARIEEYDSFNHFFSQIERMTELIQKYDNTFFELHYLFILFFRAGNSTISIRLNDVRSDGLIDFTEFHRGRSWHNITMEAYDLIFAIEIQRERVNDSTNISIRHRETWTGRR